VDDWRCWKWRFLAARRPNWQRTQNSANAVAGSPKLVESPQSPRPGGERRQEGGGLEAADPEALATAAEERTAVASQIQSRITGGLRSTALTCSSSSSANVDLY
jgi:hypothetical protein